MTRWRTQRSQSCACQHDWADSSQQCACTSAYIRLRLQFRDSEVRTCTRLRGILTGQCACAHGCADYSRCAASLGQRRTRLHCRPGALCRFTPRPTGPVPQSPSDCKRSNNACLAGGAREILRPEYGALLVPSTPVARTAAQAPETEIALLTSAARWRGRILLRGRCYRDGAVATVANTISFQHEPHNSHHCPLPRSAAHVLVLPAAARSRGMQSRRRGAE